MEKNQTLNISSFFPIEGIVVQEVIESELGIAIKLKSETKTCECPQCHTISNHCHGTYVRKVQDLPILGKNVTLEINAREYRCNNETCQVTTIAESYNGFINYYSRMTERLEDFICSLALETSCEGASRICKIIGIKISGDTVIRILLKRFANQPNLLCGSIIGVDDFAFKKRHNYGTIVVDEATRQTLALMDGRDGESLRAWLKNNKHVKVVTRDRASAYAKVITEELPDAMQVADRFHLHQNLLDAIKKALNREIPATIKIPHKSSQKQMYEEQCVDEINNGKKNA